VTAADRPYGKFYDFYSVSLETFGSTHVQTVVQPPWMAQCKMANLNKEILLHMLNKFLKY
jgi:hypothetical protein